MNLGKKYAYRLLRLLDDEARYTTMENMSVGDISHDKVKPVRHNDGRLVIEATVDEFIRERTRVYRGSWIIPQINTVRAALEKFAE